MASKPGPLSRWPWQDLGNYKYALVAPWAVRVTYRFVTSGSAGERDLLAFAVLPVLLLRLLYSQLWITVSRHQTARSRQRIVDKSLDFDQVDRERNWDDQILLTALLFYVVNAAVPAAQSVPWWNSKGLVVAALLHAGPVEFLYYWLHRALHHHFLYARYHSHHHASIVTEPITSVIHPFAEEVVYFTLFAIPLLTMVGTGTASVAVANGYLIYIDFMNYLGHCNFELVPKLLFDVFPPLKYLVYTPSFHSLHHTQFRTNYSLFMPLYDHLYGTADKSSGDLYERALQCREEAPDVVHLTHLTTPASLLRLRLGFASLAAAPEPLASRCGSSLLVAAAAARPLAALLGQTAFRSEANRLHKLNLETWVVPRYTSQYLCKQGLDAVGRVVEQAVADAEASGARVLTLGLLNQANELNKNGELYVIRKPSLRTKIVDGTSLAAAAVLHMIPRGTTDALLLGDAGGKMAAVLASALCERQIQVQMVDKDLYESLKQELRPETHEYLVLLSDWSHSTKTKVWLVGDKLTGEEQRRAQAGVHFVPYSQFPPPDAVRGDCVYHSTPALVVPDAFENLHACENWLPRRVMSAWRAAGIVHALQGWDHHECGARVTGVDKAWRAALAHGFRPYDRHGDAAPAAGGAKSTPAHSDRGTDRSSQPTDRRPARDAVAAALLATVALAAGADGGAEFDYRKLSGVIIPGFASTQLRAWSVLDCPYSPFDFNPLDSVWLDTTKLFSAVNCWLKCMLLEPYNQTDHPECKSRPDSGLSAITELDPGYITGPLSSVWKEWVKWCVEFGIEANAIIAVPYDWRLPPSMLEERDLYFHKLKLTFEIALKLRGGPSLVFAHSMGNNVFRYFLEWLKLEIAPKHYIQWLDEHIHAYFAVGAPLLGSTEAVRGALSGTTFGLPVSEGTARLMFNAFGSSLWLMPFSKHCKADNIYWKHFFEGKGGCPHRQQCDEAQYISDYAGWPTHLVNIEVPSVRDMGAYPSITDITENITSSMECGKPTLLSFSAREVSDGTLFRTIEDYDPQSKALVYQLEKYYQGDPVLNPLTPWERPPIKNVFCIYGIDSKTEVGYYFAPSGKPYPDNWIITDIIYEFEGSLLSRQVILFLESLTIPVVMEQYPTTPSPWCKSWLGAKVNITRAPQAEHDGSDLQTAMNIDHHHGQDILPNMTRALHVKYITYYEDAESLPGWRTAVWELDKANHRNIVRTPVLMRELWLEMWHDMHPDSKSKFVTKAFRGPLRNEDCHWDYGKARCGFPEHCEYRYIFGDVHLGMSCRLKNTSTDLLQQYL